MKKIILIIALLVFPFSVFAAAIPRVLSVTAESDKNTINFSGTTEDGMSAVMCKLFDSSDEEVDMLSLAVENKKFSGSFSDVNDGKYKVACARYEGGEFKDTSVTVGAEDPKTYDAGISTSLILFIISSLGILYISKNKQLFN